MANNLKVSLDKFMDCSDIKTPINNLWSDFKAICLDNLRKHVPSKHTSTRYSQPWCNQNIRRLSRRKQRAFNKYRKSGKTKDWDRYRQLQKSTQKECKSSYNEYVNDMVSQDSGNKKFFTFIKNKKCENSGIAPLKENGNLHGDPKTKAKLLNSQFSSVFSTDNTSNIPNLGTSQYNEAPQITVTQNGVYKLLHGLSQHKATGPDEISTKFLKEMAAPVTPALTLIFQASLNQGQTPEDWKLANVSPIFKKGDKSKPANYRPVSLTSVCCKVIEHIIHSHLMKFFEDQNILTDYQHGFRKKRSCESQLITTIQDLASGIDSSTQIDAILLDFSKAFDKVSHERLAAKLHHYGVRGPTLNWIKSFLAGRTQRVIVEGVASDTAPVTSGVPLGTVLGPLLFLIYINDLPSKVNSTARLFADDCLLYRHIKTNDDTTSLQDDLNNLQYWERDWQMHFNPDKCEVIRITTKRKIIPSSYFIHGKELNITSKGKYLGITISQNLSWNNHIDNVCRKANNTTAFLRRNLSSCPANIRTKCYTTFVRPQLEYASSAWAPHTQSNINKLKSVQRRAARFATGNYNTTSSVTTMLNHLNWDTLQQRRLRTKAIMMYRIINGLVAIEPPPFMHHLGAATRGQQHKYIVPYSRTTVHKESFFPSTIRLWNQLPEATAAALDLESFKKEIQAVRF